MKVLQWELNFFPCGETDGLDETDNHFDNLRMRLKFVGYLCEIRRLFVK